MGTGVVFAVIIAMWAIVLVPMWLDRHDRASEARSANRFNVAMRRLGRSESAESEPAPRPAPVLKTRAARQAARRRRNVLLGLGAVLLLTLATIMVGLAPLPVVLLPVALIAGFVGLAWWAVREEPLPVLAAPLADVDDVAMSEPVARPPVMINPSVPVVTRARRADEWEPVEAPLPTYVNAPPATRVPRLLDLRTPGRWTSAAMLEQMEAQRQARVRMSSFSDLFVDDTPAVDVGAEDLDTVIDRRAVNG